MMPALPPVDQSPSHARVHVAHTLRATWTQAETGPNSHFEQAQAEIREVDADLPETNHARPCLETDEPTEPLQDRPSGRSSVAFRTG